MIGLAEFSQQQQHVYWLRVPIRYQSGCCGFTFRMHFLYGNISWEPSLVVVVPAEQRSNSLLQKSYSPQCHYSVTRVTTALLQCLSSVATVSQQISYRAPTALLQSHYNVTTASLLVGGRWLMGVIVGLTLSLSHVAFSLSHQATVISRISCSPDSSHVAVLCEGWVPNLFLGLGKLGQKKKKYDCFISQLYFSVVVGFLIPSSHWKMGFQFQIALLLNPTSCLDVVCHILWPGLELSTLASNSAHSCVTAPDWHWLNCF